MPGCLNPRKHLICCKAIRYILPLPRSGSPAGRPFPCITIYMKYYGQSQPLSGKWKRWKGVSPALHCAFFKCLHVLHTLRLRFRQATEAVKCTSSVVKASVFSVLRQHTVISKCMRRCLCLDGSHFSIHRLAGMRLFVLPKASSSYSGSRQSARALNIHGAHHLQLGCQEQPAYIIFVTLKASLKNTAYSR